VGFSLKNFFAFSIPRVVVVEMGSILKKGLVLIRKGAANGAWKFDKWD
jgi:hypothetical protein